MNRKRKFWQQIIMVLLMILSPATIFAAKTLTQQEFSSLFIKNIKKEKSVKSIKVRDEANMNIVFKNKKVLRLYLGNAYRRYTKNPSSLTKIIHDFTNSLVNLGTATEPTTLNRKIIMPIIRHKEYLENANRHFAQARQREKLKNNGKNRKSADKITRMLFVPLTNDMVILFALDTKHNYQYLTSNDLKKYKITLKTIQRHAISNINRLTPKIEQLSPGIYKIKYDNNLDASFLLHKSVWKLSNFKVKGKLLVYVPTRGMLLVTGTNDIKNQFILQKWIDKNQRKLSYFISESPIKRKAQKWIPHSYLKK